MTANEKPPIIKLLQAAKPADVHVEHITSLSRASASSALASVEKRIRAKPGDYAIIVVKR
jgi:hypothetical protein